MKEIKSNSVTIWILVALGLFVSCKEFHHYKIVNQKANARSYKMTDEHAIEVEFSGKYAIITGNSVYSVLKLHVRNKSGATLVVSTSRMSVSSRYFDYKLVSNKYDLEISPGKKEQINLEYLSEIQDFTSVRSGQIPENEILVLNVSGLILSGDILPIEPIRFVPEI